MIVNSDGEGLLRVVLADEVLVELPLDLRGLGNVETEA